MPVMINVRPCDGIDEIVGAAVAELTKREDVMRGSIASECDVAIKALDEWLEGEPGEEVAQRALSTIRDAIVAIREEVL